MKSIWVILAVMVATVVWAWQSGKFNFGKTPTGTSDPTNNDIDATRLPDTTGEASSINIEREVEMAIQAGYEEQAQLSHLSAKARGLSPREESKEEAEKSLAMVLKAKETGDYSEILGSYWASGYASYLPPEKIVEDIERAAKSAVQSSVAQEIAARAQKNNSTTGIVSKQEIEAAGSKLLINKGVVYTYDTDGIPYAIGKVED